jgi:membrane fusion protein (multidrug efflux system)
MTIRGFLNAVLNLLLLVVLAACDQAETTKSPIAQKAPSVIVRPVQQKDVSSVVEYLGRSQAAQRVEVRARVSGTLLERRFEEGMPVKGGQPLFVIDPAEFLAAKASAEANVAKAQAVLDAAANNLSRYKELLQKKVASPAQFEEMNAKFGTAEADLAAAKAALRKAELDLGYTNIMSPITGRSGPARADVGNLIGPETGMLVTIIKLDPIKVTFAIGEREYLNFHERRKGGDYTGLVPKIRLANGKLYPHKGKFDLIGNEVDPATGTIQVRLSFPNPDLVLVPGQFVNVILTSDAPEKRVVIPQASVQENQTGPFVLVVNQDNRVVLRPISVGQRLGTEIVVLEGLASGETIIVEGIQKVRAGALVAPQMAPATDPPPSANN